MHAAVDTQRRKPGIRLTSGTKLAIGGGLLLALVYFVWHFIVGWYVMSKHFPPLRPSKVSLIGLQTGHGYSVIVSNRAAQLVEAKDYDFTAPTDQGEDGPEGASKKRIPVRGLVESLNGDEKALSLFVTVLGNLEGKEDWPTQAPVWNSEDIQKALDGDKVLQAKLEQNLDVHFDGKPVSNLSISALDNGIMVMTPVAVRVNVGGEVKTLHARIKRWYLPVLVQETEKKYEKLFKVTPQEKARFYLDAATEEAKRNELEDVRSSLKKMVSDKDLQEPAQKAEKILASAEVVLTDKLITHASYAPTELGVNQLDSTRPTTYDLDIHVNEEGLYRMWQYSRLHPTDQLLLVSDGIAIAAPRIKQELYRRDLTIPNMPDESLLQQAVKTINDKK